MFAVPLIERMDAKMKEANMETLDHWRRIAQAIWTLNYVGAGFRAFKPRAHAIAQPLDDLQSLIPTIEKSSTADVLERELREMMEQFRSAADAIGAGADHIGELLSQLQEQRARLDERQPTFTEGRL
jgi:hypothetical protein